MSTTSQSSTLVEFQSPSPRKTIFKMQVVTHGPNVVQTSKWFELPPEIRNQVYDLVTEKSDYEIKRPSKTDNRLTHWRHKCDRSKMDTIVRWGDINVNAKEFKDRFTKPDFDKKERVTRLPPHLAHTYMAHPHHIPVTYAHQKTNHGPAAWLQTCRQMHDEGGQFFYSKCSFSFGQQKLFAKFVSRMMPQLACCIERIYIQHSTYGDPRHTEHVPLKEAYDNQWLRVCEDAANKLKGLKSLYVHLRVNDEPFDLNTSAEWAQPLLFFKECHLQRFELHLLTGKSTTRNDAMLRQTAEEVKKEVSGKLYRKPARSKGGRILVIRF